MLVRERERQQQWKRKRWIKKTGKMREVSVIVKVKKEREKRT